MTTFRIGRRRVGPGAPVYMVAEMSANHGQRLSDAVKIIEQAKKAGADAIKLQTYTPDTITLDHGGRYFEIGGGSLWKGRRLYDLYKEAYTPWSWHAPLQRVARRLKMDFFSTPFDFTAVDFLEKLKVPAYKIASFEIVDLPLIRKVAATGKPTILSTGMATLEEIAEAVAAFRGAGGRALALLKCTSAYPAPLEDMNLSGIPFLRERFRVPVGLSDHTLGDEAPVAAVALGACVIEKHFILSRSSKGPDSAFSLPPEAFARLVRSVRAAEKALGRPRFGPSPREKSHRLLRRSLFIVRDVRSGETLTPDNVRSIRPAHGLHPRHWEDVLGRPAARNLPAGTPLKMGMVGRRRRKT